MTIPTSTVPTALANLLTLVNTAAAADVPPSGSPILIVIGDVPSTDLPLDIIMLGTSVRRYMTPRELIGSYQAQALEERYTIDCTVSSASGSADPVPVINRAYVLAGYVETAVRTDPTLGGLVVEAHPGGTSGGPGWTDDPVFRICELTVSIDILTLN